MSNHNQQKWDTYFLSLADVAAKQSACHSRQIGAVLARHKDIISIGYNGPPRGAKHCYEECPRKRAGYASGEGLSLCPATHAEVNAIINAARNGVSTNHTSLYMSTGCPVPCKDCIACIINAGIEEVIVTEKTHYDWLSGRLIEQTGLHVRFYVCDLRIRSV